MQEKDKNSGDFKNIYVLQDLAQPGAERVLELEDLLEGERDGKKMMNPMRAESGTLPGSHCWDYYPGALLCSQVSATHLKIGYPFIKSGCVIIKRVVVTWLKDKAPG